jgi:flagellar basal-body rod protein FlgG
MMRSLWTAASGMKTQQLTVDTIANNLANANTIGFKKERLEFKSLLYETMREAGSIDAQGSPVNLQVGHGVRAAGSVKTFSQGNIEVTEAPLDFAMAGNGFFAVQTFDGSVKYAKAGAFKVSQDDGELTLTDVNGYRILNADGDPITFDEGVSMDRVVVDEMGNFATVVDGEPVDLDHQFEIVQFANVAGLRSVGNGLFETTVASGQAISEHENDDLEKSSIIQGALESSNVQAVEEMVGMIIAQRAYELSSKAIQTSDDMLAMANNLKR